MTQAPHRKRHRFPQGDVRLPFLVSTVVIMRAVDVLILQRDSASTLLTGGSLFTVENTFATNLDERVAPSRVLKDHKQNSRVSPGAVKTQSSLFSLQWLMGALLDMEFPVRTRATRREKENYFVY
ncbi:hypothetical protein GH5_04194 [Leishmania sp. Ghana 2012 LV757]|uniref:hypothetical protein n=1 Tax=Leishmania sp. Ghana 2012 LV757 TaxID=2803181 RepID=UPI001B4D6560|nr:hypothetical protein GH5_04194 [Leishmania sp. Ghana 2012 LV757]